MRIALTAAVVLITACGHAAKPTTPAPPGPRDDGGMDVSITTEDGVRLAATHWAGPADNEQCVIFAHQLASTREEWAPIVELLQGRFELLAFDLRGHGGSTQSPRGTLAFGSFDEADWQAADRDLDAAMAFLEDRGFTTAGCAVVGSSIGGSLAMRFAGRHVDTAAVVLLSPGLAYHGLDIADAAAAYHHPALIVYSQEPGPGDVVDAVTPLWGDALQLLQVDGDAHGLAMLEANPGIADTVAGFLASVLSPESEN